MPEQTKLIRSCSEPFRLWLFMLLVLCLSVLSVGQLQADQGESGIDIGLGLGFSHHDGDTDSNLTAVAVRAHHWFSDRWGAEASLSVKDEGIFDEDYQIADLSALFLLHENERFSTFLIGGVGALRYRAFEFAGTPDRGFTDIDLGDDTVATFHVGVGFEIYLGEHFLFRPDLRHRRHMDVMGDADESSFDATVGFGWRF